MKSSQINELIRKNGREQEILTCLEELSELSQVISKCERNRLGDEYSKDDLDNMHEEIADVLNCIRVLKHLFNLDSNRIKAWQNEKDRRTVKRYELWNGKKGKKSC